MLLSIELSVYVNITLARRLHFKMLHKTTNIVKIKDLKQKICLLLLFIDHLLTALAQKPPLVAEDQV